MPHKGYKQTLEHRMKTGAYWRGRPKTPEHRAKLVANLQRLRESGITPTDFGGKPYRFPKGNKPWNTGLPDNPGLERIRQLPHGFLGKHHSKETKQKISSRCKGKSRNVGVDNPFYGHKHCAKFIEARRRRWVGEGNPAYRDGQSPERYPLAFNKELRRRIRERDDYICQLCGALENGKTHSIHHIDYDKNNNIATNLITLCLPCNSRVNMGRDGWQAYFIDLLVTRRIR